MTAQPPLLKVTYKSARLNLKPIAEVQPRKHHLARRGLRSDSLQGPKEVGNHQRGFRARYW